jgi:hypothetical protein
LTVENVISTGPFQRAFPHGIGQPFGAGRRWRQASTEARFNAALPARLLDEGLSQDEKDVETPFLEMACGGIPALKGWLTEERRSVETPPKILARQVVRQHVARRLGLSTDAHRIELTR